MHFATPAWDLALFRLLNGEWRHPVLDWLMPVVSWSGLLWLLAGLALAWGLHRQGRKAMGWFLLLVLTVGASDLACNFVKDQAGRVRPLNVLAETHYRQEGEWRQRPADYDRDKGRGSSYPSAHAANTMAAAVAAAALWPLLRPWIFLMPLLVGWSRVYLGKHYPSDVAAGWLLGLVAASLLLLAWRALTRDREPPPRPERTLRL
jgi:undecaprenyl-diphosphatase